MTLEEFEQGLTEAGYITEPEDRIAVTVFLAVQLGKPLLVTGPPGVGKTEIAKVLSQVFKAHLVRLQCYEGLDETRALYEWNYQRQLLKIQLQRESLEEEDLFSESYLLPRPLLQALVSEEPTVLLIDEIDKTDAEFEAFLFELLGEFQVTIPEMGTVRAKERPLVVLTSNGERELSDGLKRRCVFLHVESPSVSKEVRILRTKVPELPERLAVQVARAIHILRETVALHKIPSIAETLDWARALLLMGREDLDPAWVDATLTLLLKSEEDVQAFYREMGAEKLLWEARSAAPGKKAEPRRAQAPAGEAGQAAGRI
ncbi:ATPase, dynein-related, AAA domain protein [Acididesulfobacillus acetoxydans]|uniref:ATPase associated with various cellular activities AAA 5 n=1 Tax=Acididesulfobacillus acetoxydans TaxID=1561005 RepID=A0A8S0X701_9FIRM|nr:ATPase, dynein-related, AAA domain protein [Acididesulfobacillus acetoxydans]CEJ05802.1 ATPase associated with various cellular activities AAA 5 [Acididesulfobacillus acetoxydans]